MPAMKPRKLGRRTFLETVVVTAGAASVAPSLLGCEGPGAPSDPYATFPQSVASGDPRAGSIVLWTRAVPGAGATAADATVRLELATDEAFTSLVALSASELVAFAANDHCLRVKVEGLDAGTRYYYRFEHAGVRSRTGRFRTAAAPDADVPVRFAILSCQDFVGRYYDSLLALLADDADDLDFVVHLGDYVYETTGDPSFMSASEDRRVVFSDVEGAIALTEDGRTFYAARSLSNYRELYQTYRSDRVLQQVHERFPFVVVWDDHEFSDDSWQDVATYSAGRRDERDADRRRNAERAFLEHQPIARDLDAAGGALSPDRVFPENRIYRDFRFGRHVHLAMTDFRSYRPDHAIPEEAWPGAIALHESEVRTVLATRESEGRLPDGETAEGAFDAAGYVPYVDLSDAAYADHRSAARTVLAALYEASEVEAARAGTLADAATSGAADVAVLNALIEDHRAMLPPALAGVAPIDATDPTLERGISYYLLGKRSLVGSIGARYLVVASHYDVLAEHRDGVMREDVYGATQRDWLSAAIAEHADATWMVLGSSVSFAPLLLDVRTFASRLPPGFPAEVFYLNVDHWDGFPREKERVLAMLRARDALVVSGDIHAAYVTDHGADASGHRAVEVTCPGVSSSSFRGLLYGSAQQLESLRDNPTVEAVLNALDYLLQTARPALVHAQSDVNGLAILTADATSLTIDLRQLASDVVFTDHTADPAGLEPLWMRARYRVARTAAGNGPIEPVT